MATIRRLATLAAAAATAMLLLATAHAHARQAAPQPSVDALIAVLRGGSPPHDRARACQQLAALGSKDAVPALAALLADRELGAYARSGLEAIAHPDAAAALRKALGTLRGSARIGVVNSLGARRDPAAVASLTALARGRDPELASSAMAALGRIATPQAIAALDGLVGQGPRSADAADALLGAAAYLNSKGRAGQAARICQRVRQAPLPRHIRLAAAGRLVATKQSAGLPLLIELLRSTGSDAVRVAIAASRELPGPAVTRALAGELAKAPPDVQPWLVQALLDRGGPDALAALERAASTGGPHARAAALNALGDIGGTSSIPVLVKAIGAPTDGAETRAAEASLVRLQASEADAAIIGALPSAGASARARLIAVLARRGAAGSADALLRCAADPDAAVSQAAFAALATLARPTDLPELIRLVLAAPGPSTREAATDAVVATAVRIADPGGRASALQSAYAQATDARTRCTLLAMLGRMGTYGAYRTIRPAVDDADASVRAAAVRALAGWDDASPTPVLLAVARTSEDAELRALTLGSAIRMAGDTAEDCVSPSGQVLGWLEEAGRLVGEDAAGKRLLLAALGNLKSPAGLALVRPYLADPAVEAEATQAVVRMAGQLTGEPRQMAKSALEGIAASAKDDAVRAQADAAAKQIPGAGVELKLPEPGGEIDVSKLVFRPLFDGRSFEGWDGAESGAFRIEQGAVVGGSTRAGLDRNEFLCTSRSYANFVLRLECRLVTANGGIQFRSRRVPRSSEVCGYQADMVTSGEYWGCLYDESRRGMLVQADAALTGPAVKKDDWNAYEIRCEGPRIRLYVNGVQTVDYTEKDPEVVLSGIIGLQVHAGAPSETWYRNVQIADLP